MIVSVINLLKKLEKQVNPLVYIAVDGAPHGENHSTAFTSF